MKFFNNEKCNHSGQSDFSFYGSRDAIKKTVHKYCHKCGWHFCFDREWSKEQWENYIKNGVK
jgi:hypothetical protein